MKGYLCSIVASDGKCSLCFVFVLCCITYVEINDRQDDDGMHVS